MSGSLCELSVNDNPADFRATVEVGGEPERESAKRSCEERRRNGMSETAGLPGGERYEVCGRIKNLDAAQRSGSGEERRNAGADV